MLQKVPGYNVVTDEIKSKTTKNSYVKYNGGFVQPAVTTSSATLTLDNQHDVYIFTNTSSNITVTVSNTINDYTSNSNNKSKRNICLRFDATSSSADRTLTLSIPNTFSIVNGSTTRKIIKGKVNTFYLEIINNTISYADNNTSYDMRLPYVFSNVAEMKAATSLYVGASCMTEGYYEAGDGGASFYSIRADNNDTDDGGSIIILDNGNVAELLNIKECGYIDIRWFGAKSDGETDCSAALARCIEISNDNYLKPIKIVGDFYLGSNISFTGSLCLKGEAPPARILSSDNRPSTVYGYNSTIRVASGITAFSINGLGKDGNYARGTELFIENVEFIGTGTSKLFVLDAYGMPSRLSYIKKCHIHSFDTMLEAIWANNTAYGTLIANFDISNNEFYNISKIFNVVGGTNAPSFCNLNFHDNFAEWCGGFILKHLFSHNTIKDNNFEGSTLDIQISIGKGSLDFIGNYFEANSGTILIEGSFGYSSVTASYLDINNLYVYSSNNLQFKFKNLTINSFRCDTSNVLFDGNCIFGVRAYKSIMRLPVSCFGNYQYIVPYMPKTVTGDLIARATDGFRTTYDHGVIMNSANAASMNLSGSSPWNTYSANLAVTQGDRYVISFYKNSNDMGLLLLRTGGSGDTGLNKVLYHGYGYCFVIFTAAKTTTEGLFSVSRQSASVNSALGSITFKKITDSTKQIGNYIAVEDNNAVFM